MEFTIRFNEKTFNWLTIIFSFISLTLLASIDCVGMSQTVSPKVIEGISATSLTFVGMSLITILMSLAHFVENRPSKINLLILLMLIPAILTIAFDSLRIEAVSSYYSNDQFPYSSNLAMYHLSEPMYITTILMIFASSFSLRAEY